MDHRYIQTQLHRDMYRALHGHVHTETHALTHTLTHRHAHPPVNRNTCTWHARAHTMLSDITSELVTSS